jgi:two-component system, OmpR family, response regulator MprA
MTTSSPEEHPTVRVLVAEDDQGLRESLERVLRFESYEVLLAKDGAEALETVAREDPDLLVLDVMMPHVDGLAACRTLRQRGASLPILMLTARHTVSDRVDGLDAGADDYMVKPFAVDELLARVRALLRRPGPIMAEGPLQVADLVLDPATRHVSRGGEPIDLTKLEFDLLELLIRNAGIVLSREVIYERIWGYDFGTGSKSLDVYVGYLRRKTEAGGKPRLIHTVRGFGYTLREP